MTDPISVIAGKAASPALAIGKWAVRKSTLSFRVRRRLVALAARRGITIDVAELKRVVRSEKVLKSLDVGDFVRVREDLHPVRLEGENGMAFHDGDLLAHLLITSFLRSSDPSTAISIMHASFSENVPSQGPALSATSSFESDLYRLHPVVARAATQLESRHPVMRRLVGEIVASTDRRQLVEDWAKSHPAWLGDQWPMVGWLGEFSMTVEAEHAAIAFFDRALTLGATPRAYWKVRRLWAAHLSDVDGAREYLADVLTDPLVQAVTPTVPIGERKKLLEKWTPEITTQHSTRETLLVQTLRESGDLDGAISRGTAALREWSFTSAGLIAVQSLLERSFKNETKDHARDVATALSLALEIRDAHRRWGSSSGDAVAEAMTAVQLLANPGRAWALSQTEPEGGATAAEAAHPAVRDKAIVLLAERGSIEEASERSRESGSQFVQLQVRALEAEMNMETEASNRLWGEAIDATSDWGAKTSISLRLAMKGVLHPFVQDLGRVEANLSDEVKLIADLFSDTRGAENRVRDAAQTNSRLAHTYMSFLGQHRRYPELAVVAEQTAQNWGGADEWLRAGQAHWSQRDGQRASTAASRALQVGGDSWGDQFSAHVLLLEVSYSLQDWTAARHSAQSMLRLRPNSFDARWSLAWIDFALGERQKVFTEVNRAPALTPRMPYDAAIWMSLFGTYGADLSTMEHAIDLARQYRDDRQVRDAAVSAILLAPGFTAESEEPEPDSEEGKQAERIRGQVGELLTEYSTLYPDASGFKSITLNLDDPSTLLAQIAESLPPQPDLSAYYREIERGTAPIGFLAGLTHKRLAETLILERSRPRFAGPLSGIDEVGLFATARSNVVVADTTALLTVALLPVDMADTLIGAFAALRTTNPQATDANVTRTVLDRPASGRVILPSGGSSSARFELDDPSRLQRHLDIAGRLADSFRATDRVPNAVQKSSIAKQLGDAAGAWSSALDLAVSSGTPFWCDDASTRRLAAQAGVATFGTPAVLEFLRAGGTYDQALLDSIEASLIHQWTVGIPHRRASIELAIAMDSSKPRGVAAALAHGSKVQLGEKVGIALSALADSSGDPESITGWTLCLARLVVGLTNDSNADRDNKVLLLTQLLNQPWLTSTSLVFVVAALREIFGDEWRAVFRLGISKLLQTLAQNTDYGIAAHHVLALTSNLPHDEHGIVMEVVLAP